MGETGHRRRRHREAPAEAPRPEEEATAEAGKNAWRRALAAVLMALLAMPLLFWLCWPIAYLTKTNPFLLGVPLALIASAIMGMLWVRRATPARQVLRRALLTLGILGLLLPLNGVPFLVSELGMARKGMDLSGAGGMGAALAMLMIAEDAIAGIVVAAVAFIVRWALRPRDGKDQRHRVG
jgi:peptidoglycan/LPS O-acetylase OafA/YrhL